MHISLKVHLALHYGRRVVAKLLTRRTSVPISGIAPELFHIVLYYVYGGKPTEADFKSHAKEIVDAADRFGIVNLKLEAEVWYVKLTTIDVGNVMELLLYADVKNCALIKETVMDFIDENGDDVLQKVHLEDVPRGIFADLLAAMARGNGNDAGVEGIDCHPQRKFLSHFAG